MAEGARRILASIDRSDSIGLAVLHRQGATMTRTKVDEIKKACP
jgi:hypothetical protein